MYTCTYILHLNLHYVYYIIAFEILVHHGVVIIVDPGSCFLETEQAAWSMAEVSQVTIACLLRTRFVGYDASWQGPLGLVFSLHPALACNPCSSIFQMQLSDRVQLQLCHWSNPSFSFLVWQDPKSGESMSEVFWLFKEDIAWLLACNDIRSFSEATKQASLQWCHVYLEQFEALQLPRKWSWTTCPCCTWYTIGIHWEHMLYSPEYVSVFVSGDLGEAKLPVEMQGAGGIPNSVGMLEDKNIYVWRWPRRHEFLGNTFPCFSF